MKITDDLEFFRKKKKEREKRKKKTLQNANTLRRQLTLNFVPLHLIFYSIFVGINFSNILGDNS